ncbi:unnamed protein product [Timema podura]|uniref:Uncharacterized protein n=1 Tax=Timema podura TaxID=61482 RepID=A0ABN7PS16_TIMPD|nr:unnamed protein product [Timema podura]
MQQHTGRIRLSLPLGLPVQPERRKVHPERTAYGGGSEADKRTCSQTRPCSENNSQSYRPKCRPGNRVLH